MLLCLFFILCVPFRGAVKRNSLFISLMARWIRTFVHTMFKPHPVNTVQCSVLCLLLTCLPFLINLVALEALGQSLRFLQCYFVLALYGIALVPFNDRHEKL